MRYDMILEGASWRIDDIRGTIDTAWSVRKILSGYVAFCAMPEHGKECR